MIEYIFTLGDPVFNEETREAVFKPEVVGRLIRCKDCIWYLKDGSCARHLKQFESYDFCSYGERGEADD